MTPVPLGSFWDGLPTGGDEPGERPACPCDDDWPSGPGDTDAGAAWTGGPATAWSGGALALVGITLPWATVEPFAGAVRCLVQLTDLSPFAAPIAALMLVAVGVGAAVSFHSGGRSAPVRWLTAGLGTVGAVAPLALIADHLLGTALVVRDPVTSRADVIRVGHPVPGIGCAFYVLGLLLVAAGVGGAGRLRPSVGGRSGPAEPATPAPFRSSVTRPMRVDRIRARGDRARARRLHPRRLPPG